MSPSATPATQSESRCHQVPRLPRKMKVDVTKCNACHAWAGFVAGDAAKLCMAGVALGDIHLHLAWQAWHLVTSTFALRGRRCTWQHPPSSCVAGVALGDIGLALVARLGGLGRR